MNPKDAIGRNKPGLSDLPVGALFDIGNVMRLGAEKYGAYNWRLQPISASVYYNAMLRHLARWWEGESIDKESNQHHLAHVAANCCIMLDAYWSQQLDDDRPKPANPVSF